jgi:hypothetical protein
MNRNRSASNVELYVAGASSHLDNRQQCYTYATLVSSPSCCSDFANDCLRPVAAAPSEVAQWPPLVRERQELFYLLPDHNFQQAQKDLLACKIC